MKIDNALLTLGLQPKHIGYWYLSEALVLCQEDSERITAVLKALYWPIAQRHLVSVSSVEVAMRRAIRAAWLHADGRTAMEHLLRHKLPTPPSNRELLSARVVWICRDAV